MKKLILGFLVILAVSCTPGATQGGIESLLPDPYKAALQLYKDSDSGGEYTKLTFFAGEVKAEDIGVYIGGKSLKVADENCTVQNYGYGCELGDMEPGETYTIRVVGLDISANATFYRPGTVKPSFVFGRYPNP